MYLPVAAAEAICGNGIVEEGEECDCGYDEDKSCKIDKCCKGRTGAKEEPGDCKLLPEKTCRLDFLWAVHWYNFKIN